MQEYYDGENCLRNMHILLGHSQFIGFLKGNVYKYVYRMGRKNVATISNDAMKARDYLSYLIKYDTRNDYEYLAISNELRPVSISGEIDESERLKILDRIRSVF